MPQLNPNQCPNRSYQQLYGETLYGSHEFIPIRLVHKMEPEHKFPTEYTMVACKFCLTKRYL